MFVVTVHAIDVTSHPLDEVRAVRADSPLSAKQTVVADFVAKYPTLRLTAVRVVSAS